MGLIPPVTDVATIRSVCDPSARRRTASLVGGLTVCQLVGGQFVALLTRLYIYSII
jgi:hypothetical protein